MCLDTELAISERGASPDVGYRLLPSGWRQGDAGFIEQR